MRLKNQIDFQSYILVLNTTHERTTTEMVEGLLILVDDNRLRLKLLLTKSVAGVRSLQMLGGKETRKVAEQTKLLECFLKDYTQNKFSL